jgi:hypothetical protein
MTRPASRGVSLRSWTPRLLTLGGLLIALVAASLTGFGSNAPGTGYCYTSCLSVSISSNGASIAAGSQVSFSASISGGTAPYTYSWNFGDGSATSTAVSPSHTFSSQGSYSVVLTIQDATGTIAKSSALVITVGPCTTNCGSSPNSNGTSGISGTDLAALIAAIIIAIVVALVVVLLVMRKRKSGAALAGGAYAAGGGGYIAEPPPAPGPQVDPTSMEPPPDPSTGSPLPPPPTSDDIPGPSSSPR